jgi:acyl transferase domain-containing protein/NAD(P)-dependent dehydrogenase (short-subunit alcohol dehydrogenase family)/acyl carrier protein
MPGGIRTPDQLWQLISAGKDGVREVPSDRWDWRRYYSEDREAPGKIYVRKAAFLEEDIKQFDAEFFGISPREAKSLDPQQRLLLETSWEAIDDAGLSLDRIAGSSTGVYIGGLTLDNMLTQMSSENAENIGPHSAASSTMTMLSNRLSYFLDLHGPSLSLDTACSSSLVAFHLACQALWNDECEMALVGAVNVMFRPEFMMAMCKGQFLSPDGRSKSFDDRADGYGRGEGAGVIVVKPWWKALADFDRIYALVRATGCNQDGKTNGITVPNGEAQKSLILSVLDRSDVPADRIHYVEAHGTGTPLGDPIEARAIGETLGRHRNPGEPLTIGSIKANVGHLEAASGVAGLIKLCMCYKYNAIPPIANLDEPNRAIPFDTLNLRLPTTLEPLPSGDDPIFFAINSFGYGGTNAHAILENPPSQAPLESDDRRQLVVLPVSARSESALRAMVAQYRDSLMDDSNPWQDFCAAVSLRRTHHDFRAAFVGNSRDELIAQIDEWLASQASGIRRVKRHDGKAVRPVFVFSGMGPQWWGMGQQLFERERTFREFVTRADQAFQSVSGWSILEEMRRSKDTSRINQTIYAQPAIFVLQAGLTELLKSWGVRPDAVIGHSLGENAAAYAADVLTLEQAVHVGYHRSQLLARAAGVGGGMLAVGLSEDEAHTLIAPYGDKVTIAAINGPRGVTLSGDTDALAEVAGRLKVKSVFSRTLHVEVAYHSSDMDPLQQPLIDRLVDLRPNLPSMGVYSTVTGAAVTGVAYDGPYWARNIRQSVQFVRALASAVADGHQLFLEVGAHPALTASIREYATLNKADLTVIPTLVRETDECKTLFRSLAALYAAGCDLNWAAINGLPAEMVSLPAYPWQRELHWEETPSALEHRVGGPACGLSGRRLDMHEPVWERQISNKYLPYIDDHVVQKLVLLPGAAFVDAALGLQKEVGHNGFPMAVEDLHFRKPLVLDRHDEVVLRTAFDAPSSRVVFHGKSQTQQSGWTRHAEARLSAKRLSRPAPIDLEDLRSRVGSARDVALFYSHLTNLGLAYGPNFRRITEIRANGREVLAKLTPTEPAERYDIDHVIHPALLDSAFQSLLAAIENANGTGFVPAAISQVAVFDGVPDEVWSYGHVTRHDGEMVVGDLSLLDAQGRVFAMVTGMRCAAIPLPANGQAGVLDRRLFHPAWPEAPLESTKRRAGAWLVVAEGGFPEDSFAATVADRLRREKCERLIAIDVEGAEDWGRLFTEHAPRSLAGIAYLTSRAADRNPSIAVGRAGHLLELFKQLSASDSTLRAYLVTERAEAVRAGDAVEGFLQASAAGFFRVAHNEYPSVMCTVIDHDGELASAEHVVAELLADDQADDVAWRAGVRYMQRIEACTLLDLEKNNLARRGLLKSEGGRSVLARTNSGFAATGDPNRDVLYWKHEAARELADDQIEIEVAYWQIRGESSGRREQPAHQLIHPHWREFSGRVCRVGTAVESWRPGDPIAAAAVCVLASHVIVREQDLRAIRPGQVPAVSASSMAITQAAVNVALRQMARAERGESVLVVGSAHDDVARKFVEAAKDFGLDAIVACADQTEIGGNRALLDLASNEFERSLLAANRGRAVDIVVFCGFVPPALHNGIPLAFGGRVVLYGAAAESVEPARFVDPGTMYSLHRVDPTALAASNVPVYQRALIELEAWARNAAAFSPERVCAADGLSRESLDDLRNGGSRAVDMSALGSVAPASTGEVVISPDAAYVITGGFGGFGMAVAGYLIAQGARHVVLIGRSGAANDDARRRLATWRAQGVTIREELLDITNHEAVDALVAELSAEREVKGIMHAAGVVRDGRIGEMTRDQLAAVMRPKVLGAWNFHVASVRHRLPLDHFVLFSSVASLVGNGGQANYVAANAVLDSLAAHRAAAGLAATSVNWGALAEVGMATNDDLRRQFQLMGINPSSADDALAGLHAMLRFQPVQMGVMDVDWVQWGKFEPTGGKSPRFAHLTGKREGGASQSVADSLRQLPAEERFAIVEMMLAEQVAQTLRIPVGRVDPKRPLTDMGIDSLMTVELQLAINMTFGIELSALELTRGFSISQLTSPIIERMGVSQDGIGGQAKRPAVEELNVDDLSEAELDLLIAGADDAAATN